MAFLDRFRKQQPSQTPRGASGRGNRYGFLNQDEQNVDLLFPQSLRVFDRMYRTDPDIRRGIWMVANPIISGTWSVEPYGGDEAKDIDVQAAEFVRWALFEQMAPRFKGHLSQALPVALRSGFAPFEQIWTSAEWKGKQVLVPKTLGLRLPRTILRFNQEDEDLVSLTQLTTEKGQVTLPAEDLIYYRLGAEGDNWEGISLLRAVHKPWMLKDDMEKIDAIKQERQATGVPICYPPAGNVDPGVMAKIEEILAGMRTAEQSYIVAPGPHADNAAPGQGWRFEILSHNASEDSDVLPSLQYHSDKIAAGFIAEFMRLGQGQGASGARAVGDVQQNPFLMSVDALAGELESTFNTSVVERLVALNFDVEEPPALVMSLVDSTSLTELADYVQKLVTSGALHADPELEDFLRERADLPPEDPDARKARLEAAKTAAQAAISDPPPPPAPGTTRAEVPPPQDPNAQPPQSPQGPQKPPPAKPAPPEDRLEDRQARDLRWWEEAMDLDTIESSIAAARTRFQEGAGDAARAMVRDIADASPRRTTPPKPPQELVDAITAELEDLYRTGRRTVTYELDAQRRRVQDAPDADPGMSRQALRNLTARAVLAANAITQAVWQVMTRLGLSSDVTPAQRIAAGEAEAGARLRAEAIMHAAAALNVGRDAEANAHADEIVGSRYTSILDTNRCGECAQADDDVLRPLDDPVRIARRPPNSLCEGGNRCRCMEFFQLKDESASPPGEPQPVEPPAAPGEDPASHFDVSGGSATTRQLVDDQVAAIKQVHTFPDGLPTIPMQIKGLAPGTFGRWEGKLNPVTQEIVQERILLNQVALLADPPITSAVHEIGHFLDAHGFGDGPPPADLWRVSQFMSSTSALSEWRQAVTTSGAYQALVAHGGTAYTTSIAELFARSYEQWIALKSGNEVLLAKIAARRATNPDLYWSDEDFTLIAEAFERFFTSRGLL